MKKIKLGMALAAINLLLCYATFAAPAKTYQVTGPILEVNDKVIIVQKGDDRWEVARDEGTKIKEGDLKVGKKVTIEYRMTATSVEVKDANAKTDKKKK
jgi:hypothetical protein